MLLPSKSKSLGQYNTKSRYVSKKAAVWMGLLTDQISLKKYFMLILGVTFLVPSQYCFPRLQLHITKKYEIIFVPLCFYLRLLKKGSKSVSQISQTGISNILSILVSFVMSNLWNLGHTFVPKLSQKYALNSKIHTHRHTGIWFF